MKRFHELIQKHLDQVASAAEMAELDRCLVESPAAAAAFAEAGRLDAALAEHFRAAGRIRAVELLTDDGSGGILSRPDVPEPNRAAKAWHPPVRFRRWLAAAVVLLTLGGMFLYRLDSSAQAAAEVVSGQVLVNGVPVERIPQGAHIEVAGDAAAVIRLPDGAEAELTPASAAVFRPRALELLQGGGKFQIGKNGRGFRVETAAGNVTARNTEFSVELRPDEDEEEGPEPMNPKLTLALVVAVTLGQVEVDCGGQKRVLSLGESRVFAADKPDGGKKNILGGKVAAIAADGKSITVEGKTPKPTVPPARTEIKLTDKTAMVFVGMERGHDRPTVGAEVTVFLADGSPDTAERVVFGPREPQVSGRVQAVAADGRLLTLEIFRKNEPATTAEIVLTDRTRVSYPGIGKDDEQKPTVGYGAQVWLAKDSKDTAVEVQFFNKKAVKEGAAEPQISGRIVAVTADGAALTLEAPSKIKGGEPTRATIKITADTKLAALSGNKTDKPAVGDFAAVTLARGAPDTAVAVKFGPGKDGTEPKKGEASGEISGAITAVAADSITLELPPKIKGDEAKRLTLKITATTKLVPTSGNKDDRPAVGQVAVVLLAKNSKDTADLVKFGAKDALPKLPNKNEPKKPAPEKTPPKPGTDPKPEKPEPKAAGPADPGNVERVRATVATIDADIDRRLTANRVPASPRADDAEFLRRVCLDITGRLPTYERTIAFLDSTDPEKRRQLIDELLASPAYGQHFGILWKNRIWPRDTSSAKGPRGDLFAPYLAQQFNQNRGWDRIVYDLLTVEGTIAQNPQMGFILANSEGQQPQPTLLADAATRLFLGVQLQCAQCHDHPFTAWKQTDYWSTAAFFSRIRNSSTKGQPGATLTEALPVEGDKPVAKGEKGAAPAPFGAIVIPSSAGKGAGQVVRARFLGGAEPALAENEPLRPRFAAWAVAADNPYFAPAAVNRLWAHFFGRGLVHPMDNMHADNPPSHPELLNQLADEFRASGCDQKHLIRSICNSAAYQRTSRPLPENETDQELLSHMAVKVLSPEVLFDALAQVAVPRGGKTEPRDAFLNFFGTPADASPVEFSQGIPQILRLMNGPQMNQGTAAIDQWTAAGWDPDRIIAGLYLTTLSRRPTAEESQVMKEYLAKRPDPKAGYAGVLWILLNCSEFAVNK